MDDELITTPEAAEMLGVKAQTLRKWRMYGKGPCPAKRTKLGWMYHKADVDAYEHVDDRFNK